jgi:hypothetical protein
MYVALTQVLAGGTQKLTLNTSGTAIGGSFNLNALSATAIRSLVIPANVIAIDQASKTPLVISGRLSDQGLLVGVAGSGKLVDLVASSIYIGAGGAVTTSLTPSLASLIASSLNNSPLNLSLTSYGNIANAGSITSSGSLSLHAGGSIINALPTGIAGAQPVISAVNGLNMFAGSGQFVNSGVMQASTGAVNFSTLAGVNMTINNTGGQVLANAGTINFRNAGYTASDLTSVSGGLLSANALNFYGGNGAVSAVVEQINGLVNVSANTANVLVSEGTLNLGTLNLSGDPTMANMDGDIVLNGGLTFKGQNLAILAEGNVTETATAAKAAQTITLAGVTGVNGGFGGTLTIAAGFTITSGVDPGNVTNPPPDTTTTYSIASGSGGGGSIQLPNFTVITSTTVANANAGEITLVASAGSNTGSGAVSINTINASATATGSSGGVLIIAPSGITVAKTITTTAGGGGLVTLSASTPFISGGTISFKNGAATEGAFSANAPIANVAANISTGAITTNASAGAGGTVLLQAPGSINVAGVITTSAGAGFNGGAVTLDTLNDNAAITVTGAITTLGGAAKTGSPAGSSGAVNISATGAGDTITTAAIVAGGTTGAGNTVTLQAPGAITVTGAITTTGGAGFAGGAVSLQASGTVDVTGAITTTGGAGFSGGTVTLTSLNFNSAIDVTGSITTSGGNASATGTTGGSAGTVTLSADNIIQLGASIIADGGNAAASGAQAGAGGAVSVTTTATQSQGTTPITANLGLIAIKGAVDARGGNATNTTHGAGGSGGSFTSDSATLTVAASTAGGASINVTAGTGKTSAGSLGVVTISTYGVEQGIPTDFNLIGTTKDTAALPGAVFTVGSAVGNGTAGNITNGTHVISATTNPFITSPLNPAGSGISITPNANSASYSIIINGTTTPIGPTTTIAGKTTRTMLTPGEALALYQMSHGSAQQTLGLNASGQVIDTSPQSSTATPLDSTITIQASDLPAQFTAFNLSNIATATGITNGFLVTVTLTGSNPVITLPPATQATIGGILQDNDTSNATLTINMGTAALVINDIAATTSGSTTIPARTGQILMTNINSSNQSTATPDLTSTLSILSPTATAMTITDSGIIEAGTINIQSNKGTIALNMLGGDSRIGLYNPVPDAVQGTTNIITFDKAVTITGSKYAYVLSSTSASGIATLNVSQFVYSTLNISTVAADGIGANITMTNTSFGDPTNQLDTAGMGNIFAGTAGSVSINTAGNIWSPFGTATQVLPVTDMVAKTITITDTDSVNGTVISLLGSFTATNGNVNITANANSSGGNFNIFIGDQFLSWLPNGSTITADHGSINLSAGDIELGGAYTAAQGSINIISPATNGLGDIAIAQALSASFTAGSLKAVAPTSGSLPLGSVATAGSINIIGSQQGTLLQIGDSTTPTATTMTANGGNITMEVAGEYPAGDGTESIALNSGNTFQANGGSIIIATLLGTLDAGTTNIFNAYAVSTSATAFTGGGVQLSAGTVTNSLTAILAKLPATFQQLPSATAISNAGITLTAGSNGEALVSLTPSGSAGTANLNAASTGNTTAVITGGALVIEAVGSTSSVTGTSDQISTATPISYQSAGKLLPEELIVDTGEVDSENDEQSMSFNNN